MFYSIELGKYFQFESVRISSRENFMFFIFGGCVEPSLE
ncbi:hypothetical protein LEP1GSC062_2354 [Leptospira alexanderi serovar Manhao 3 str. L 60]|uniref:Uncharacterized protein n=1 Tax=Leptospira alexanderi serovar Manhao 3 str. L 60 TaxID=1049759 RepID=V6I3K7_9LEPT|nr:hypothetical protein LEP1GSC062_2354 [Leptospira alexanderi serovar Manhao 3 str. L 60]